ncbi:hypothetical protein GSI_06079 [Ganoderma sinense ZZ0214-1]|uniref:Prolyl 4-hydroxylase alpha subunit Fe(2+) 2OG dioxygenase domain-containing protein n=1 Tax=Ganoderma sinense ZZ0214-1 TaxID=1077348 RepID=A0A2G8SC98_9APHY|nr:hypothetical protein GSI_06079 [Ganoderma sinense ZZ0214-1]
MPTLPNALGSNGAGNEAEAPKVHGRGEVVSHGDGQNQGDCGKEDDGEEGDEQEEEGDQDPIAEVKGDQEEEDEEGDQEEENEDEEDEDEDEDDDEEDGDEDEEINIREELSSMLEGGLEFTGAISFTQAYPTAPNPILDIEGLGIVGLPLSSRDAAAIKACAEQAPFGMADQTVVDKTVSFVNEAWQPFLKGVLQDVCQALGVNFDASKPLCELYKLLLYETGSHFLPHVDTEKVDGMFATIVIVLPAKFTGGAVHVSHGGFSETYEHSARSQSDTTVLAWYTDVEHEVKPVASGYRLALSFNVIHTTNSLRPIVSNVSDAVVRLRRVLASWAKNDHDAPDKIIYLLHHKYSHANMSGSALKGSDAHLVAMLDNVGRSLGFRLGLANLTCTESGCAQDDGYGRRGGWGCYTSDEEDDNEDDVEMEEVTDTDVQIAHLVDMDGTLIRETIVYNVETDVIPYEVAEEITAGHYDDQSYEGYMGNGAGSLERYYRRTVLVIWPPSSHFDIIHGGNGLEFACKTVHASTSICPTQEELELVQSSLESVVRAENSNVRAIQFLDNFENWVEHQQSEELTASAIPWIEAQRTTRFSELKEITHDSSGPLIELVLKHKDVDFLEQSILPVVKEYRKPHSLKTWAIDLHNAESIPQEARTRMAKDVLSVAMSIVNFYKVKRPLTPSVYYRAAEVPEELKLAQVYAQACLDINCEELFALAVPKLLAFNGLQENVIQLRVKEIILPLITYVSRAAAPSRHVAGLGNLARKALALHLKATISNPSTISPTSLASMMQAATACGQSDYFLAGIIPKLEAANPQEPQLRTMIDQVHAKRALLDPSGTKVQPVLLRLLKKWALVVNVTSHSSYSRYGGQYTKPAISALEYCLALHLPEVCAIITKRLLQPAKLDAEYIKNQLAPLLPDLSALLVRRKQPPSSPTFAPLFRTTLLYYVEKVLGPRPDDTLSKHLPALNKWTCNCDVCPSVRKFLTSGVTERMEWQRIGPPKRRHLEQFLSAHASSMATFTMVRTTPQGLIVTKAKNLINPARWMKHQKNGLRMLKSISEDPAVVKTVLGTDHANISELLLGRSSTNATAPAGRSNATVASANAPRVAAASLPGRPRAGVHWPGALGMQAAAAPPPVKLNANNKRPHSSVQGVAQPHPASSVPAAIPASTTTNAVAGSSNVPAPPAKRRKTAYNNKDVIDLT